MKEFVDILLDIIMYASMAPPMRLDSSPEWTAVDFDLTWQILHNEMPDLPNNNARRQPVFPVGDTDAGADITDSSYDRKGATGATVVDWADGADGRSGMFTVRAPSGALAQPRGDTADAATVRLPPGAEGTLKVTLQDTIRMGQDSHAGYDWVPDWEALTRPPDRGFQRWVFWVLEGCGYVSPSLFHLSHCHYILVHACIVL